MSYYCKICFKQIGGNEVFGFMQSYKKAVTENLEKIAEEECLYSPYAKNCETWESMGKTEQRDRMDAWVNRVLRYRFFYLPEENLLGMFSVEKCMEYMFDGVYAFQNSTDQDYEFEYWKGIAKFERIAQKWKTATLEMVIQNYEKKYGPYDYEEFDEEYCKKASAYDEIWSMFSEYLENDESALYLSLYGFYEICELEKFSKFCVEKYDTWVKKNF